MYVEAFMNGQLRSFSTGSNWPFSVSGDRLKPTDSVEKVGFGFHSRKVRA
jgi:hypothetical protein